MLRIGIVGCGTIGSALARYIDTHLKDSAIVVAISDIDAKKGRALSVVLAAKPKVVSVDTLIGMAELVIEAASSKASFDIAKEAISAGKDIMIMSSGGLLKNYKSLLELAERKGVKIYLPSGAICGLDGLKAAMGSKIKKVTLTTKKPPKALKGAPYFEKRNIDLDRIKKDKVIFEGNALEAIENFPANINVAATLSLCGIGPEKTRIKIIASPSAKRNIHEVEVEGEFGRLIARTENVPSPNNPKTSYLAILSAIAMVRGILGKAKIGT